MPRTPAKLRLDPDRCDRCGRCMEQCESNALKVGASYIYVDWRTCDGCLKCVKACDRGAIQERTASRAATPRREEMTSARGGRASREKSGSKKPRTSSGASKPAAKGRSGSAAAWTFPEAGAVLAIVLLAFVAKDAAFGSQFVRSLPDSVGVFVRVVILGLFYAVQFALLLFLARRHGGVSSAFDLRLPAGPWWRTIVTAGLTLALLLATRLFTTLYGASAQSAGWDPPATSNAGLTEVFGGGSLGLVLAVVLVVLVGPLVEEIVFRGVLLPVFRASWGAWPAILVSAAMFGLYHFSLWMFVPAFALGVALGWLAHARDGLWPAVVMHAFYNGVAVAAAFYVGT